MKSLFLILCGVAITAGVFVGYLDHIASRYPIVTGAPPPGPDPSTSQIRTRSDPSSRDPGGTGEGVHAAPSAGPRPERPAGREEPAVSRDSPSVAALQKGLLGLEDLVGAQQFDKAVEVGTEILRKNADAPLDLLEKVARVVAKARVLDRVVSNLPDGKIAPGTSDVLLANGLTVRATSVDRDGDRYVIHLAKGGTFSPAEDDVLEVKQIDSKAFLEAERKAIEEKVAGARHPVDVFLDGVQRYYALGLKEEGLRLLEGILATDAAQTEQVALLFVPDADDALLDDWRVAAGRERPVLGARGGQASSVTIAGLGEEAGPSSDGPASKGPASDGSASGGPASGGPASGGPVSEGTPSRATPPIARLPGSTSDPSFGPVGGSADTNELIRAAQLVAEAQVIYQGAIGREGKDGDLGKARDRLDRALEIVEGQPGDDEIVKRLRRQIGQLLSDVARASPF